MGILESTVSSLAASVSFLIRSLAVWSAILMWPAYLRVAEIEHHSADSETLTQHHNSTLMTHYIWLVSHNSVRLPARWAVLKNVWLINFLKRDITLFYFNPYFKCNILEFFPQMPHRHITWPRLIGCNGAMPQTVQSVGVSPGINIFLTNKHIINPALFHSWFGDVIFFLKLEEILAKGYVRVGSGSITPVSQIQLRNCKK